MTIAGHDHLGAAGLLPGSRSRQMRTLVVAGVLLVLIWTIKKSPLFRDHVSVWMERSLFSLQGCDHDGHTDRLTSPPPPPRQYESGFTLINPDHVPSPTGNASNRPASSAVPAGPNPIALPGDSFYLTDALHTALNPPTPPPPTPDPSPPPPPFPDSAAVIMETSPSAVPNLVPLMLHFAELLGPKWPVVLVTLRANWVEPPSPAFRRLLHARRIQIVFLPDDTAFPSHESVSVFFTQPWFWEQFASADRVLLFQADSILCANSEAAVDDFAHWDLVGAPIASQYGVGYNGGLSLRNPRAMLAVLADPDVPSFESVLVANRAEEARVVAEQGEDAAKQAARNVPSWQRFEDQWFYWQLKARGDAYQLPDVAAAKAFAVETVWHDRPLGYHQPFRWLTAGQKTKAVEWCPELAMLQDASHFF